MASDAPAVCEYCGETFANALQLGPHKKFCWTSSYGYESSTCSFTNSDSSECNNSDSGSATDTSDHGNNSDSDPILADEAIGGDVSSLLMSLAQREQHSSWLQTVNITNNNNNNQYLPSRTRDFTPVRPVTHHI